MSTTALQQAGRAPGLCLPQLLRQRPRQLQGRCAHAATVPTRELCSCCQRCTQSVWLCKPIPAPLARGSGKARLSVQVCMPSTFNVEHCACVDHVTGCRGQSRDMMHAWGDPQWQRHHKHTCEGRVTVQEQRQAGAPEGWLPTSSTSRACTSRSRSSRAEQVLDSPHCTAAAVALKDI